MDHEGSTSSKYSEPYIIWNVVAMEALNSHLGCFPEYYLWIIIRGTIIRKSGGNLSTDYHLERPRSVLPHCGAAELLRTEQWGHEVQGLGFRV